MPEDKDPDIDFETIVKIFTICLTNNEAIEYTRISKRGNEHPRAYEEQDN